MTLSAVIPVDLNPPQLEAVKHTEGPLLVLAGAGSGKTRVLACRAAHLIHSGIARPYRILALTFTNKAAAELKSRVIEMSGEEGRYIVAGTFHSIFARIMRQEGLNIGINPNFSIVDSDDKRRLIKALLKELGYDGQESSPTQIDWMISKAKNSLVTPDKFVELARYPLEIIAGHVYQVYEERLNRMDGLDFDDLLSKPLWAFSRYPEFLQRLQNRFQYVMVDEYQDTNQVQYMLVREIARGHGNICVVGDDDQAIYGFRGASVDNILDFEKDWNDAKKIHLEQNYRSTKPILDVAWSVIHNNSHRHPKKLWTDKIEGQPVEIIRTYSDDGEARRFVAVIDEEQQTNRRKYNDFAILYRVNAQSLAFEQVLRAAQIPYKIVGGLRFYERKEIKDVLAYLRLIVNPSDDISLQRIINYPPRGISDLFVKELHSKAIKNSRSIYDTVLNVIEAQSVSKRRIQSLTKFAQMIENFKQLTSELDFSDLTKEIMLQTELRKRMEVEEKDDRTRAESKLANLDSFIADIIRFTVHFQLESSDKPTTVNVINAFLEEVALVTAADEEETADRVNLLTMHSAKGLEFPVVFISGLEEGLFPMRPPDGSEPDVEEERRLFYVGATRAMERLLLGCTTGNRFRWGDQQWKGESRFIKEIPRDLLKESGMQTDRDLFSPKSVTTKSRPQTIRSNPQSDSLTSSLDEFYKGVLVRHPKFGLGIVLKLFKKGLDSKLEVDFDDYGKKTLIFRYARLEIER